jgi:hypothetical protein
MTITGPANGITVQRDTGGNYRIFNILGGATVSLSNLTVTNGRFNDGTGNGVNTRQGAGIFNAGNLTLTGVTVSNNNTGGTRQRRRGGQHVSGRGHLQQRHAERDQLDDQREYDGRRRRQFQQYFAGRWALQRGRRDAELDARHRHEQQRRFQSARHYQQHRGRRDLQRRDSHAQKHAGGGQHLRGWI